MNEKVNANVIVAWLVLDNNHSDRIVGGENADKVDKSFVVSIQFYPLTKSKGQPIHVCGGTIVLDKFDRRSFHQLPNFTNRFYFPAGY